MKNMIIVCIIFIMLLCLVNYGIDYFFYLKNKYCRFHIGHWNRNDWEQAIEKRAIKWLRRTPTVKITDNSRYMLLDFLNGKYKSNTIQSWQKAALILGLLENESKEVQKVARKTAESLIDVTGNWKKKPVAVDCGMLSYAILKAVPDKYTLLRVRVIELFTENKGRYGYRRIHALLKRENIIVSEKVIRRIMKEEQLVVKIKRTRKYNSYQGEISPAVDNLINRNFSASKPNEKWLTDITEFAIPAGKVYLSPIVDCFDGLLVNWNISTSPDALLVNSMLDDAAKLLSVGEKPIIHSDRGVHYRWPGWIDRMEKNGFIRSMSKKGCSPDNSACEGVFGRIKNEMFYNADWSGVNISEFIGILNDYLYWYNEKRIKKSLGYLSPIEYRHRLGLVT